MTTKQKNRCSVTLRHGDKTIGTFRPDQKVFYSVQKELEPYRTLYEKAQTIKNKYRIILKQEDVKMGTYKVKQKHFFEIKQKIDKYRSLPEQKKKIRCVETGIVFECARDASKWVEFVREIDYCRMEYLKLACKGKRKTSYGYHWEFVQEGNNK